MRHFIIACLCMLVGGVSFSQTRPTILSEQKGNSIRVASHNLLFEYKLPPQPERQWKSRLKALADLYERCPVDIIGSQEALGWQGIQFMDALGFAATGVNQVGYPEGSIKALRSEYERIFYKKERLELKREGHFWFSENPDIPGTWSWDASHTRMCTWAKFKDRRTGTEFYVFNSHFHFNASHSRAESAKLLLDRVKKIAGNHPVFCTGDFNGLIDSEAIKIIDDSGVVFDSRKKAGRKVFGPSVSCHGFKTGRENHIIDHIFVSADIKVREYHIIGDELQTGQWCSDHLPVIIDAEIGQTAE